MRSLEQFEPVLAGNRTETAPEMAPVARFIGIDLGAETLKLVELLREEGGLRVGRREILEHGKKPGLALREALEQWHWPTVTGAAVCGRFASQIQLPRVPLKQAQLRGYRFFFGQQPATIVNIGSHGFSVLELRAHDLTVFRENSRCSQGTGNFLRQLVERFSLSVEEASRLCADVENPSLLSGRCPVILKTDMTHLANKGEDRACILAGLFDAVCANVLVLLKPGVSPSHVLLVGGVSRAPRVRRVFGEALARQRMELMSLGEEESLCLEALGSALVAADGAQSSSSARAKNTGRAELSRNAGCAPRRLPALEELVLPPRELKLERLPALTEALGKVRRLPARPWPEVNGEVRRLVLGFDIGSTGAKLVALDLATLDVLWEAYRQTLGDPVGAAQDLLRRFTESPVARFPVVAFGATGSGREVTGSLLTSCYGKDAVFIVNEIVAHATGALHYDSRVDTIFEIGGQDAKYIRLAEGRIIDCAMNEACSAGTGSFIEEQGRKFAGIEDVRQLGQAAVAAKSGVSLGQHCSVFMAEVIDEGVAAGVEPSALISGLYDSIIKNYLNRVKGNRSVGKVIFCQGMPFSADALAAAVARQTGSQVIVPPNPGTVGALGIALLAARELPGARPSTGAPTLPAEKARGTIRPCAGRRQVAGLEHGRNPMVVNPLEGLDLSRFLTARVEQKDTFVCRANTGCGGTGNHCRIERLRTLVSEQRSAFTWGGGCALHDKATRKRKLPDLAPDPFRERETLLQRLVAPLTQPRGNPCVALCDEFMLKGLFPFFAAFLHHAGLDLEIVAGADHATLKRGIQSANVPFCAPMQLFHGLAERMAETGADWLFVPMIRSLPRPNGQRCSSVCPIVQASPDVLRCILESKRGVSHAQTELASGPSSSVRSAMSIAETSEESQAPLGAACAGSRMAQDPLPLLTELGKPIRDGRSHKHATPNGAAENHPRLLSPRIDFGKGGLESQEFLASCERLGRELGLGRDAWRGAWEAGAAAQREFDAACLAMGQRALEYCRARDIPPVIVLGRGYTIYNQTLNSNVPAILREQGAIGIPVDCYSVEPGTPHFEDMYWGYGQQILRAAHQARRAPGVYALYCSNYSCGPDSFNLHFAAYVMEGKPFAIIETDGHSGDAGTKTRVEAFLHCVEEDRRKTAQELNELNGLNRANEAKAIGSPEAQTGASNVCAKGAVPTCCCSDRGRAEPPINNLSALQFSGLPLREVGRHNGATEKLLIPYIGPASDAVAAVFRGVGLDAESLPAPDSESLRLGRRHTSGKECLPMPLTLGSLLQRLERARDYERFVYVMPSTDGPCRFGVYNLLNQIVLHRLSWRDRVRIWSPKDTGYFDDLPAGTEMLMLTGILASDLLLQARLEVRPVERVPGETDALYQRCFRELLGRLEAAGRRGLALGPSLWQVASGRLFGVSQLLDRAGAAFAALREDTDLPLVELTGEIYVRAVEFSNDFLARKLEARRLRVRPAPQSEWLAYCAYLRRHADGRNRLADRFSDRVQHRIESAARTAIGPHFGWPIPPSIPESLAAAEPFVNPALQGEAVLTVGATREAWRRREIDAAVAVGPLECMPTKIAEAQFHHLAERDGLLSLTLAFNGDPISTATLDNFAFEVNARFRQKHPEPALAPLVPAANLACPCPDMAVSGVPTGPSPDISHVG